METIDRRDIQREENRIRKKELLLAWLAKLEEVSLQAEDNGDYGEVLIYDLQKQILELLLRIVSSLDANESFLVSRDLQFKLRPEAMKIFAEIDRPHLLSIISV